MPRTSSPLAPFLRALRAGALLSATLVCSCQSPPPPVGSNAPTAEQVLQARDRLSTQQDRYTSSLRELQREPLADFIVLAQDTPLFHSEEAARAASPTPPAPASAYTQRAPEADAHHLATFVVLQDKQDVAEVGILSPDQLPYHCTATLSPPSLYNLEIRLWVRKDAIVPVLSEPWTTTFENKTAYSFLPGTPVRLSSTLHGDDRTHLNLSAHGFSVDITQDDTNPVDLALSYTDPFSRASSLNTAGLSALPSDTVLWIGQKPLLRVAQLDRPLRYIHQQRRFDSQNTMVALASSCVQIAAVANRTEVLRASSSSRASTPYRSPLSPSSLPRDEQDRILYWSPDRAPESARTSANWIIRWPDQSPAGVTRSSRTIQGELDVRASDESGMQCYIIEHLALDRPLCIPSKR